MGLWKLHIAEHLVLANSNVGTTHSVSLVELALINNVILWHFESCCSGGRTRVSD